MFAQRVALVIGIDGDGLRGCVNDARAMGLHLTSPLGGGFDRVDYLLNHNATPQAILSQLNRISTIPRELVVVFYAGHGNDRLLQTAYQSLYLETLADYVQFIPARHRMIILDACESGAFIDHFDKIGGMGDIGASTPSYLWALQQARPGLRICTATNRYESAVEVGGRGMFTKALLLAPRNALPDLPGNVLSLERAFRFAESTLVSARYPRPMGVGSLHDFPFGMSDVWTPVGSVVIGVGRDVRQGWNTLQVSASVKFQGRKGLPTQVEHQVVDGLGYVRTNATLTYYPEDSQEIQAFTFTVPGWVQQVSGATSRIIVRDDRSRVLSIN